MHWLYAVASMQHPWHNRQTPCAFTTQDGAKPVNVTEEWCAQLKAACGAGNDPSAHHMIALFTGTMECADTGMLLSNKYASHDAFAPHALRAHPLCCSLSLSVAGCPVLYCSFIRMRRHWTLNLGCGSQKSCVPLRSCHSRLCAISNGWAS